MASMAAANSYGITLCSNESTFYSKKAHLLKFTDTSPSPLILNISKIDQNTTLELDRR